MKIRTASAAILAACVITSSCSAAQLANFYCKAYVESFQISFASTNVTLFGVTVPTGELTAILDWEYPADSNFVLTDFRDRSRREEVHMRVDCNLLQQLGQPAQKVKIVDLAAPETITGTPPTIALSGWTPISFAASVVEKGTGVFDPGQAFSLWGYRHELFPPEQGRTIFVTPLAGQGLKTRDRMTVPLTTYNAVLIAEDGAEYPLTQTSGQVTIVPAPPVVRSPGDVKLRPDGAGAVLKGAVVTATPSETGGRLYVSDPGRSSGIGAVAASSTLQAGDIVDISGPLTSVEGERLFTSAAITKTGARAPIAPLKITLRSLASGDWNTSDGAGQRGVTEPPGANTSTVGMLVEVSGLVKSADGSFIYLDDGSWPGLAGVRVESTYAGAAATPGKHIIVRGISSMRRSGADYQLVLKPRKAADFTQVD